MEDGAKKRHRTRSEDKSNKKQLISVEEEEIMSGNNLAQAGQQNNGGHTETPLVKSGSTPTPTLEDINDSVKLVEFDCGQNAGQLATHEKKFKDMESEILLLKNLVLKQHNQIGSLQSEVEDLRNRSMRSNILLHGIPESARENVEEVLIKELAKSGLANTSSLVFERVHRIGPYNAAAKKPRSIVAKLLSYKDTERILNHARTLPRGSGNPFITPQLSTATREKRKKLGSIADEMHTKAGPNTTVKTKIANDKLFVNGNLHLEQLPPPNPASVLQLPAHEREEVSKSPPYLTFGEKVSAGGQFFQAAVTEVRSKEQARRAYRKLLTIPACMGAAHNISACVIGGEQEPSLVSREWQDDGEWGAGRFLSNLLERRHLTNLMVVITRRFDKPLHIGSKRFDAYEEAAKSALDRFYQSNPMQKIHPPELSEVQ